MRGGRGRGGRGRGRDDFGVTRPGPVTEETAAYPPNPRLGKAPLGLDHNQQCLVALNRILINYWKFQSPFQVKETIETPPVQTYSSGIRQAAVVTPKHQLEQIVNLSGPEYFPKELLQDKYTAPRLIRRPTKLARQRVQGEQETDGQKVGYEDEDNLPIEEEEFGADDYIHDHYGDEDMEENEDIGGDEEAY